MAKRSSRDIADKLKQLAERSDGDTDRLSLIQEVHVYQEELTAQNQELTRAQVALEETRDRLMELYDFAPNGYLTLDPNGLILQINLTGAAFIGKPRNAIEGMPLIGFIAPDCRPKLLDFLRLCRAHTSRHATFRKGHEPDIVCELAMSCRDGRADVQFLCRPRHRYSEKDRAEFFVAVMDISERKLLEADREKNFEEHITLTRRLLSVQDEERHRIARDLHDNIGQQVTSLRLLLDVMSMAELDDTLRTRVRQSLSIVEQLDRHLDFIAGELRPASLDFGLPAAIDQFVREWSANLGIAAAFTSDGMDNGFRLGAHREIHVYRVVQEALNNVAKHAHAESVRVSLKRTASALVLKISDDGCGFRSNDRNTGLGLVGMRERAQIVGGSITVDTEPGDGTTISLRMPLTGGGKVSSGGSKERAGAE